MLTSVLSNTIERPSSRAKYKTQEMQQPVCVCVLLIKERHDQGFHSVSLAENQISMAVLFFFFFFPSGCEALIHVVVLTYKWRQTAFHEKTD